MAAPIDLNNLFTREVDLNNRQSLKIYQSIVGDVGCVVWDAALVLTKYLETNDFQRGQRLADRRVVELGSGTGVVGLAAACHSAHVILTDLPEFVPLMQKNIDENQALIQHPVRATALPWGQTEKLDPSYKQTDFVLLADCIYYDQSLEPLVSTIGALCGPTTEVYCCYEERHSGNKPALQKQFFKLIGKQFNIEKIPLERQDENYRSEDIHIWKFTKKKLS